MKKKTILSLVALSALAIAMLILYMVLLKKESGEGDETPGAEEYFTVLTLDMTKVDRLTLNNESTAAEFSKEDGVWKRTDTDFFPVKQQTMTGIENVLLSNLNAFSKISDPAALSEYGLESPAAELSVYQGETELCTIFLGDKLPTKEQYYCRFSGDEAVYTVSANYARYMCMSSNDFLADLELPNIDETSYLREIRVEGEAFRSFHAVFEPGNAADYSGSMLFPWVFYEPLTGSCLADTLNGTWLSQMEAYCTVRYEALVAYRPGDLGKFGLDEPCGTLTVSYTDANGAIMQEYCLKLGTQLENGSYYACLEGVEWIFTVSQSEVERKFACNIFEWAYHTVIYPATPNLSQVLITAGELQYLVKNEGTTSEEGLPEYTVNGKRVSDDAMAEWRNQMLVLKTSGYLITEVGEDETPVLTIQCETNREDMQDTVVEFYPYSDGLYKVVVNGYSDFTIDSRDVVQFLEYMKATFSK